jgi:hypothetical protein
MIFSREAGGNRSMISAICSGGNFLAKARDRTEVAGASAIRRRSWVTMYSWFIGFGVFMKWAPHGMERVSASKSMIRRKAMSAAVMKLFIGFSGGSWF